MAGPIKKSGYSRPVDTSLMPALKGWVHACAKEKTMLRAGVFIADGATRQVGGCEIPGILESKQTIHSNSVCKLS